MTTRNHLLAVASTATLVAGSLFLTTAPATAAPDSQTCVSARAELGAAIDSASVDIALAYDLKAAFAAIDQAAVDLEAAWLEAELAAEDEGLLFEAALVDLDNAGLALDEAQLKLEQQPQLQTDYDDATKAVLDAEDELELVDVSDEEALAAARAKLAAALTAKQDAADVLANMQPNYDAAAAAFDAAERAMTDAETAYFDALFTEAIMAAEDKFFAAIEMIESILVALDGPGTSPEQVEAMVDAVIEACASTGAREGTPPATDPAVSAGVVSNTPVSTNRGLNIQSAAGKEAETSQTALSAGGLLAGIAVSSAVIVMVRRRTTSGN